MTVTYRDFSAWVTSEGAELPIYKPTVDEGDGRTFTCWIPSEEGKVHWMDHNGGIATVGHIFFDGSKKGACNGAILLGRRPGEVRSVSGAQVSHTGVRPFVFAKLETTEDDFATTSTSSELGSIRLSIHRVIATASETGKHHEQIRAHGPVHEKSKKAGSHVARRVTASRSLCGAKAYQLLTVLDCSYGQEEPTGTRPAFLKCQLYDPMDKNPYVRFIFKYRSLALLQANDIAPPPAITTRESGGRAIVKDEYSGARRLRISELHVGRSEDWIYSERV
ncbi:hypothetical protein BOTBODRAFT_44393 [Botryobasidium botryosum FD-172 SS1]|uniref:DUF7918 domain-containing protein n=1 Tax=Botryobasidium botryosum (strain FD-172 SS1) TaxID=930990 RepID=A0A067MSS9_BOTB1|nr:hypothetical protein BOTBODRAFT_44393 [Botryobasidium botryosum FD-172 SS1]